MEVPSLLYRFIIGKRGDTKRKIEKETGTQIMIPRQGEEGEVGEFCWAWLSIFKSLSTYLRCTAMLSFSIFSHGMLHGLFNLVSYHTNAVSDKFVQCTLLGSFFSSF